MKRKYNYGTVAIVQPKKVSRTYVSLAKSKSQGYYTSRAQRYAAAFGQPGLLGVRPGFARTAGFYGRYHGPDAEMKFLDTALAFNFDNTAEVPVDCLNVIIQNDTQNGRDGRKVVVNSIQLKGAILFSPGAAATNSVNIFLYLMQDTQCNGAAPTASGDTGIMTGTNLATAYHNLSNGTRFKTLKRWKLSLNPAAGATTALNSVSRYIEGYLKCNIPIEYDASAATGALTTVRSNNLFLLAGADGNSDDTASIVGSVRIRYRG